MRAHSVAPGVVDTAMQEKIRATPESRFPEVARFTERKRRGDFNSGSYVADEFLSIAFDPERDTTEVAVRLENETPGV